MGEKQRFGGIALALVGYFCGLGLVLSAPMSFCTTATLVKLKFSPGLI